MRSGCKVIKVPYRQERPSKAVATPAEDGPSDGAHGTHHPDHGAV